MITIESAQFEIDSAPESLKQRLNNLGLKVTIGPSPNCADTLYLEVSGRVGQAGVDLDGDALPQEINGWILKDVIRAFEVFTAEKDSPYSQMEMRA